MTTKQKAILNHVVVDADAWYVHSVVTFGEEVAKKHLAEKVKRWEDDYKKAIAKKNYKTRAERQAEENALRNA